MTIKEKIITYIHGTENFAAFFAVFLLALFPTIEVVARLFKTGVANSLAYTQYLGLILTFIAAMITSREKQHLSLSLNLDIKDPYKRWIDITNAVVASMLMIAFACSAFSFSLTGFDFTQKVGPFHVWWMSLIIVLGFIVIGIRFIVGVPKETKYRGLAWLGIPLGLFLGFDPLLNILAVLLKQVPEFLTAFQDTYHSINHAIAYPLIILLIVSAIFGARIFIVLGGIGFLLFARYGLPLEAIPDQAFALLTSSTIPAIPLFTVTGFLLSESKAGERLVQLFKALFGFIPGGLSIMAIMVCAFFTTFTGASGVTILALGGLLIYVLEKGNYSRRFSVGLLTASGSIGLLFPPSLPIIIYGVTAQINIKHLFIGGILPGFFMVLVMVVFGVMYAKKNPVIREPFHIKEVLKALRGAIWEMLLPVVIVFGYFGGYTNLVESSAIAVLYTLIIEVFVNRDLKIRDLPNVVLKSIPIIGGVLIILALANGLSYYMIDAEIPMKLAAWMNANIHSKYVFLLLLNIALLITGCFMDIFSAILVVVPLILPLGELFGIHPVHLGIIFLANLELGYLTPPVGLNLFLAAYRFKEPMVKVYKDVLPFLFIQVVSVLIITYVPFLSIGLLNLLNMK